MNRGGITERLVQFARTLVGHFHGGLAQVNILSSIMFAGLSGSAVADTSALGSILIPGMEKDGYPKDFSAAVTAASSIIGPIIPPSIIMIVYSYIMEISTGALLAAGVIPGVTMGIGLMMMTSFLARRRGYPRQVRATFRETAVAGRSSFLPLLTPMIILGGILFSVVSPTEAAIIAVAYALFLSLFILKTMRLKELPAILSLHSLAMDTDQLTAGNEAFESRQHFSIWMQAMCTPWQEVLILGHRIELSKNQTLFGEGKPVKGLYFNQKGILRLISVDQDGREAILFYVTENNLLGEAALFNGMPVYAFFKAVEDCTLYFFEEAIVRRHILPKYPHLTQNLLEYFAFKVGVLLHHHCEIINPDVRGKVCRLLYDMCRYSGLQHRFAPKITLQEMATALGLHRATLSKVITDLKKESIIAKATIRKYLSINEFFVLIRGTKEN